ncbi:alpha/beta hydrolase family protein [Salinimicrobium oceani]|uniref:Alpha/beta hydrolase n=1 Tax=Salinimicrobium oceani TaxID=2722702 RepID=A0ABX1CYL9_9FLAO|nr:alpha/beta fold hydrolase [Salinimicrobium oceani]NJW51736.1 alpha/beta hydrolase [Salinimicrobium oceani]
MKNSILSLILFIATAVNGQVTDFKSTDHDINEFIKGTLVTPATDGPVPLVLMLQGSGPTDRNGNQSFMKNDAFKKLAHALAKEGIATYRYDKRIFQVQKLGIQEQDMRFDDFVIDAVTAIEHFTSNPQFTKIVVLGHSQGSLVGMLAAKGRAQGFISIAGLAQPIDAVLTEQITSQMPGLKENVEQAFSEMRAIGSTSSYNPVLESIFRPSVQPFILSWMHYDPKEEIKKLDIPVLLINGSNDLQVKETEAENLQKAYPQAEIVILKNMNHILREIEGDNLVNSKSYNEPGLPLHPELVKPLVEFIKK